MTTGSNATATRATAALYCFVVFGDDNEDFGIVTKAMWQNGPTLDENFESDDAFSEALPEGFYSTGEGVWGYEGDSEEGRQKLLDAGFEQVEKPSGW